MPDIYAKGMTCSEYAREMRKRHGKVWRMTNCIKFIEHNGGVITWPNGKPETNDEIRGLSE